MPFPAPVKVKAGDSISGFTKEDVKDLHDFIKYNVKSISSKLESFRTEKLPEYVRLYKGIPKDKETNFPWPGAANLVIQLIGTFCDELLARTLGGMYLYDPLFSISLSGDAPDKTGEEMKRVLEKFLMDEAYDPASLDFYRFESAFYNSGIKYGTGIGEFPWEYSVERNYVHLDGGESKESKVNYEFHDVTKHDGPKPRLVPLNKFGIDPRIPILGDADFFYTEETLNYWQVKDLYHTDALMEGEEEQLMKILASPDSTEPKMMQQEIQNELKLNFSDSTEHGSAEWTFCKCYIRYRKGNQTFSLFAKYHQKTETVLYSVYNFYPKNMIPVEDTKLSYDDETYFGTGYAQMLRAYQKELSQNSNWRTNNRNFAMLGIFRIEPDSKLSSILQLYPGVMIPAKDGNIERIQGGADVGYNDAPDQFIMSCAKERAGVDPATGGTGGGIVNPKRGIYSASGTAAVMMQQNNRNNLRMSDMRSAHVRIAIKLTQMYASFGIGDRLKKYGDNSDSLKKALEAYKTGSLGFRLRPTTASNNKEMERQNDVLLANTLSRFYQENAQMIQALVQPNMPPQLKQWYNDALLGNVALMKDILRNFNRDDVNRIIPDISAILKSMAGGGGQGGAGTGAGPEVQSSQGLIPAGGLSSSSTIPQ